MFKILRKTVSKIPKISKIHILSFLKKFYYKTNFFVAFDKNVGFKKCIFRDKKFP